MPRLTLQKRLLEQRSQSTGALVSRQDDAESAQNDARAAPTSTSSLRRLPARKSSHRSFKIQTFITERKSRASGASPEKNAAAAASVSVSTLSIQEIVAPASEQSNANIPAPSGWEAVAAVAATSTAVPPRSEDSTNVTSSSAAEKRSKRHTRQGYYASGDLPVSIVWLQCEGEIAREWEEEETVVEHEQSRRREARREARTRKQRARSSLVGEGLPELVDQAIELKTASLAKQEEASAQSPPLQELLALGVDELQELRTLLLAGQLPPAADEAAAAVAPADSTSAGGGKGRASWSYASKSEQARLREENRKKAVRALFGKAKPKARSKTGARTSQDDTTIASGTAGDDARRRALSHSVDGNVPSGRARAGTVSGGERHRPLLPPMLEDIGERPLPRAESGGKKAAKARSITSPRSILSLFQSAAKKKSARVESERAPASPKTVAEPSPRALAASTSAVTYGGGSRTTPVDSPIDKRLPTITASPGPGDESESVLDSVDEEMMRRIEQGAGLSAVLSVKSSSKATSDVQAAADERASVSESYDEETFKQVMEKGGIRAMLQQASAAAPAASKAEVAKDDAEETDDGDVIIVHVPLPAGDSAAPASGTSPSKEGSRRSDDERRSKRRSQERRSSSDRDEAAASDARAGARAPPVDEATADKVDSDGITLETLLELHQARKHQEVKALLPLCSRDVRHKFKSFINARKSTKRAIRERVTVIVPVDDEPTSEAAVAAAAAAAATTSAATTSSRKATSSSRKNSRAVDDDEGTEFYGDTLNSPRTSSSSTARARAGSNKRRLTGAKSAKQVSRALADTDSSSTLQRGASDKRMQQVAATIDTILQHYDVQTLSGRAAPPASVSVTVRVTSSHKPKVELTANMTATDFIEAVAVEYRKVKPKAAALLQLERCDVKVIDTDSVTVGRVSESKLLPYETHARLIEQIGKFRYVFEPFRAASGSAGV